MDLKREINISKKFIIIMLLVNIIVIGLQTSYAYFQVNVIKKSVVVIKTAVITMSITSQDLTNNKTLSLASGESKTVTLTITNESEHDALARLYYIGDITDITFESETTFKDENDIPIGRINKGQSQELTITITNNTDSSATIELGAQEGLIGYELPLYEGRNSITLVVPPTPASVVVANAIADKKATNSSCTNITVEEDGITYLSGKNTCIDFNYVWYSGKLWRITAIYPDGTMKLITDNAITAISYGPNYNFYTNASTTSWIYQWLNEDFLDTLYNYENIIVTDSKWNVTSGDGTISTKLAETTMVNAKVGLLNSYEYYMSYKNLGSYSNGYLNIGYYWWLSNPQSVSSSFLWYVYANGGLGNGAPSGDTYGGRPSVNLKSTIKLAGGTGIKSDPYRIKGDKEDAVANTTLLNTRNSGEYVNFDGELYRIVGIENNTTKLNKVDYVRDASNTVITKCLASTVTYGLSTNTRSDDFWDYYLNNTWYNNISSNYKSMLEKGTYYLGTVSSSARNYKLAICNTVSNTVSTKDCTKTSTTYSGYVGLPRYGEMFSSQLGSGYSSSSTMMLITSYDSSWIWRITKYGGGENTSLSSGSYVGRPSINLKSSVKITGGTGLPDNPFEVSLP